MTVRETERPPDSLCLRSQLSDMALIPAWIAGLASQHAIPDNIAFAINLCLEEAVSNIIRHGYGAVADGSVIVRFTLPSADSYMFVVEDQAQAFNPLDAPTLNPHETPRVGGRGIAFLRQFASQLEYEPTSTGNRLRIGFAADSLEH